MITRWIPGVGLALLLLVTACAPSGETVVVTDRPERIESTEEQAEREQELTLADTVEVGDFDLGRMWTFADLPQQHFEETYGFVPDQRWFTRARLGALRFADYCSGSYVSPSGLVATNHHCGRESISKVSREGENLLQDGFYAPALGAERRVPDLHVDQLVRTDDVTTEVYAALENVRTAQTEAAAQARAARAEALQQELTREAKERDPALHVEVVEKYNGAKYSAHTYRRHQDVRLVMAPEMQVGFSGGDADESHYSRYALDVAFFRVYDAEGDPVRSSNYFPWSPHGSEEGEAVFVVGTPGATERHNTVSQLEFQRDHELPRQLEAMQDRIDLLRDFFEEQGALENASQLRNTYFSLENSVKSTRGQLEALQDPELMARREAGERQFRQQIADSDTIGVEYAQAFTRIQSIQHSKQSLARQSSAYTFLGNTQLGSPLLTRAIYGYYIHQLARQGASDLRLDDARSQALEIDSWPQEVEEAFMAQRFSDMRQYLGANHPTVRRVLGERSPEELARYLAENSVLTDSSAYRELLEEGYMNSGDPSVAVAESIGSHFFEINRQRNSFRLSERDLNAQLSGLRYELSDGRITPDGNFTPRIADGVVTGHDREDAGASRAATFQDLFDQYASGGNPSGELPPAWLEALEQMDLSTPLNLISTNDVAGGNSGSALLNRDLEVVGIVFDSNTEVLPNMYLYREDEGRTVSVDSRGILVALDQVYEAGRLVEELRTGRLIEDEAE